MRGSMCGRMVRHQPRFLCGSALVNIVHLGGRPGRDANPQRESTTTSVSVGRRRIQSVDWSWACTQVHTTCIQARTDNCKNILCIHTDTNKCMPACMHTRTHTQADTQKTNSEEVINTHTPSWNFPVLLPVCTGQWQGSGQCRRQPCTSQGPNPRQGTLLFHRWEVWT